MSRKTYESSDMPRLSDALRDAVKSNGGWLNVIGRMTNTFDAALQRVGRSVDCPFVERHGPGHGLGDFRFSEKREYEGRAICTCMQGKGMAPIDLLMEDGIGKDWTDCVLQILKTLDPTTYGQARDWDVKRKPVKVRTFQSAILNRETLAARKANLRQIALGLIPLSHPDALAGRKYFAKRGIPWTPAMKDVKFHPGLDLWISVVENGKRRSILAGKYPAIVSAFRTLDGRVVNFHRIYINSEGNKAAIEKPKKICSGVLGFTGSSIIVAEGSGRTLHITEGVEKAWAIHLATGETVKAAYCCTALAKTLVNRGLYDRVVIWSDNDPINPKRERKVGDGQYFAWDLAKRLFHDGFDVMFMLPERGLLEGKMRDWEDIIVEERVLDLDCPYRKLQTLRAFAARGGVEKLQQAA